MYPRKLKGVSEKWRRLYFQRKSLWIWMLDLGLLIYERITTRMWRIAKMDNIRLLRIIIHIFVTLLASIKIRSWKIQYLYFHKEIKPNFIELFNARQSRPQEVNFTHSSFNQKLAVLWIFTDIGKYARYKPKFNLSSLFWFFKFFKKVINIEAAKPLLFMKRYPSGAPSEIVALWPDLKWGQPIVVFVVGFLITYAWFKGLWWLDDTYRRSI